VERNGVELFDSQIDTPTLSAAESGVKLDATEARAKRLIAMRAARRVFAYPARPSSRKCADRRSRRRARVTTRMPGRHLRDIASHRAFARDAPLSPSRHAGTSASVGEVAATWGPARREPNTGPPAADRRRVRALREFPSHRHGDAESTPRELLAPAAPTGMPARGPRRGCGWPAARIEESLVRAGRLERARPSESAC